MNKTILIADDNAANRELIREVLERCDYRVIEAGDGEEAVRQAREGSPDLALVDIEMPRLDGYGVLKQLRGDPQCCHLRVVALTGYGSQDDREQALDAGFDGYISKPVEIAMLRQEVRKYLYRTSQASGA